MIREGLGLSVHAFAQRCGVPNTAMRNYLAGQSFPSLENLYAIARAVDVSLDWLVRGQIHPPGVDRKLLANVLDIEMELFFGGALPEEQRHNLVRNLADFAIVFYSLATAGGPDGVLTVRQLREKAEQLQRVMQQVRGSSNEAQIDDQE